MIDIYCFKREQSGQKATEFNPKIKDSNIDWIGVYGKVATTGVPEHFETYSKSNDKWYQIYIYSPKKTFFCFSIHGYNRTEKKSRT